MFEKTTFVKNNLLYIIDVLSALENVNNPYITDEYIGEIESSIKDISIAAEIFLTRLKLTANCQKD